MQAGIYVRLSFDPEGSQTATARQEADCRRLADDRGWNVHSVYEDADVSAYKRVKRPEFERLIADVEAGVLGVVIVWRSDRLTRQPRDLERFVDACERHRVALVSVTEPFDVGNAMGLFMLRQFVAFANLSSAQTSERVARKARENAELGREAGGGLRAYGYDDDRVTIRHDEAAVIREVAGRVIRGEPIAAVVRDLNARSIPTATGKRWNRSTLRTTLIKGRIAGLRTHHGVVVAKGKWPAIITVDQHEQLRAILESRSLPRSPVRVFLLRPWIECGRCHQKLVGKRRSRDGARVYACVQHDDGREVCGRLGIVAEPTERRVAALVLARLDSPAFRAALQPPASVDEDVYADISMVEDRLARLTKLYVAGDITDRQLAEGSRPLRAELESLRRRIRQEQRGSVVEGLPFGSALEQLWERASFEWRHGLLGEVLDRVVIMPATRAGQFDHQRIDEGVYFRA